MWQVQQRQCLLLTHALPPTGQRRPVEGQSVDGEFLLQKVLRMGIFNPPGAYPLAGEI